MRTVMSVSVSKEMLKSIKKIAKEGSYSSVSEFCRYVIRCYIEQLKKDKLK
ncbi:MAG: ribbon-helix-helix protein, CopG family [Candidatus Pacebacteria bacterium]|nr:ribbon-helix-helix protein, CopG family [Candidatus Paceibacterota bacterium]